ncbi:hypothetical protein [Hyphomicrobium sp. CS1GBMeth3]|uniref:hypothetical protein n=1 Tax=Hyphomicrobium sp. CS1GBMeth3 TaxID=1892845 RepID=UPI0009316FFE|nr:hypothetical protein [Hyphomicrobium sp. CS1GBMeth3]
MMTVSTKLRASCPSTLVWIDASDLGSDYYDLIPNWMQLVEQRAKPWSSARLLGFMCALAVANEVNDPTARIHIWRWVARYYRAFRPDDDAVDLDWLDDGPIELIELGFIRVRGKGVELTWPPSHALYAAEPQGTA